ncbi:hypothetical protein SLH46_13020 [Draconibacterium sp. IB214405]|uniref:hypothetical protein n=1 Tax=Draconibacterium sp. IB214405 TaxID=3097352 RepID=UPI002A0E8A63|nr:hypothetical protein [Draconibacterium sp. IB214405]MDX8340113.1 hypothetical protein [Draconibacterium sp. IB214405]
MSLQYESNMTKYANVVSKLWKNWRSSSTNQLVNEALKAVKSCTTFMPPIDYRAYSKANFGDFGVHYPGLWRIEINRYHAQFDNITLEYFIEWALTPYHESRHAEQTYRIAQGVLSNEIKFPTKDLANKIQLAMKGRSPKEIRQAYETGNPFEVIDSGSRQAIVKSWLNIPTKVIVHADTHRSYFKNFISSTPPLWMDKRSGTLKNAVIDWMKISYDRYLGEIDRKAQGFVGEKTKTRGFARMYMSLPEEKDAYGIEKQIKLKILNNLGKSFPADENVTPP